MSTQAPNGFTTALNTLPAAAIPGLWAERQGVLDETAIKLCPPQPAKGQAGNITTWDQNGMVVVNGTDGANNKKDYSDIASAGTFKITTTSYQLQQMKWGRMVFTTPDMVISEGGYEINVMASYANKLVHQISQLYAYLVGTAFGTSGNYANTASGAGLLAPNADLIGAISTGLTTLENNGVDTSSGMKILINSTVARTLLKTNQISGFGGAIAANGSTTYKLGFAPGSLNFSALRQFFMEAFDVPLELEVMRARVLDQQTGTATPTPAFGAHISLTKSEGGWNSFARGLTLSETPEGQPIGNVGTLMTGPLPEPIGAQVVYADMACQVKVVSSQYGYLITDLTA